MEIELQQIPGGDFQSTVAKLQLQGPTDVCHFGCGPKQLPQRINQTIILLAACAASSRPCQYLGHVPLQSSDHKKIRNLLFNRGRQSPSLPRPPAILGLLEADYCGCKLQAPK